MKYLIITSFFLCCLFANGQGKYLTKKGVIEFEASVPLFEEVKAKNNSVTAILNSDTGEFASLALIKGFRFKVALMEEHFNENYMDSNEYPKAILKGKIKGFSLNKLNQLGQKHILSGTLMIHGKTKEIDIPVILKKVDNIIHVSSTFSLTPEEFNIKIPKLIRKKVAQKIDISVDFKLHKKSSLVIKSLKPTK